MLKSMTGYGTASHSSEGIAINVEVRTLNSKYLDLNLRLPRAFNEKEIEIRNIISEKLERGKVSLHIDYVNENEVEPSQTYNKALFKKYYTDLRKMADSVVASDHDLFRLALSAPDVVVSTGDEKIKESDWKKIKELLLQATQKCDEFRIKEGSDLQKKFETYIQTIDRNLSEIEKLDPARIERIRNRIKSNLAEFVEEEGLDKNRLEQELVYYIEKLDITEEKVRLASHLKHFSEVLHMDQSMGKKLGFISQEIGREINTIGSKANDADIQKFVVDMKESLEKIKEQVLNIV
ncbi:MAG: YicC/YloC family endoribonuclease [Fulvivirga sp.]|nr:YicC/YloC family endoribonuclease [Fulvivirga sp.]